MPRSHGNDCRRKRRAALRLAGLHPVLPPSPGIPDSVENFYVRCLKADTWSGEGLKRVCKRAWAKIACYTRPRKDQLVRMGAR